MSAIAFELPSEIREACDGLAAFARAEIFPRHENHRAFLEDPRRLYREDGRFSDEAVALIRDVRRAAFYTMCVPEALGGGGLGHLAYYAGWEHLFRLCGPQNWLMLYVISHWAFGPSRLFERVTDEARRSAAAHREVAIPSIRPFRPEPIDHLFEFELLRGKRDAPVLTVAASLLFGSTDSLKSNFPQSETVLMVWKSLNKPLTDSRWSNIINGLESHLAWITRHMPRSTAEHLADEVVVSSC